MRLATACALRLLLAIPIILAGACATGVEHKRAEGAIGPYSGAVLTHGFVFASGKIGSEREGAFAAEASSAIDAVEAELARSDLGLADVVSVTVYLTDMTRYAEFNAIYAERFPDPYPARTCVAVAALPAGARVEITAIAIR